MAARVAAILDSGPLPEEAGVPWLIQEIAVIRSATRAVLEAELPADQEQVLLGGIAARASRAELSLWCLDAITAELRGPDDIETVDDVYIRSQERLTRAGYSCCPVCRGDLASDALLKRMRARNHLAVERAAAWEGAAPC